MFAFALAFIVVTAAVAQSTDPSPFASSKVVFYRTGGIRGVLRSCDIFEGNQRIAHLSPNTQAEMDAPPGPHFYALRGGTGAAMLTLKPGETAYVRCRMVGMVARPALTVSDQPGFAAVADKLKPSQVMDRAPN